LASASALTSKLWPRSRPRPQDPGLGLGLGLEILASFNITGNDVMPPLEIMTLNQKSHSVNRCVLTWRRILPNFTPIRFETTTERPYTFLKGRPQQQDTKRYEISSCSKNIVIYCYIWYRVQSSNFVLSTKCTLFYYYKCHLKCLCVYGGLFWLCSLSVTVEYFHLIIAWILLLFHDHM